MKKQILFLLSLVFIISLVSASENYEFNDIQSNQLWYDTGVKINEGDTFYIKYSGSFVSTGVDQDQSKLACPHIPKNTLAGKIGDSGCFDLSDYKIYSEDSGNLFIAFNDYTDSYSDNEGSWMVSLYIADKEDSETDSASSTKQEYKSYEEKEEYYKAYEYSEEELKNLEKEFEDYFKKAFEDGLKSEDSKIKVKWSAKFGDEVKEFDSEEEFEAYHKEYFGFGAKESMAIPFEFKWNADSKESEDEEEQLQLCSGCLFNDKCLPMGLRLSTENPVYCSSDGSIKLQKQTSESCDNSFECLTNQCSNQKCFDLQKELEETRKEVKETKGLLQSFWDWLKGIFSFGD